MESGALDDLDASLLRTLTNAPRASTVRLAETTGVSVPTARRRIDRLVARGAVRTTAIVDPAVLGFRLNAGVALTVPPHALPAVGEVLGRDPHVHGAVATTGSTNLFAAVFCTDEADLYRFTTDVLGALPVTAAQVNIVTRTVKRANVEPWAGAPAFVS